jgi:hypothetical protein
MILNRITALPFEDIIQQIGDGRLTPMFYGPTESVEIELMKTSSIYANSSLRRPPIYEQHAVESMYHLLTTQPVVYLLDVRYFVSTMLGRSIPIDKCQLFQISRIPKTELKWGAMIMFAAWYLLRTNQPGCI